jgi:hypothetical protein
VAAGYVTTGEACGAVRVIDDPHVIVAIFCILGAIFFTVIVWVLSLDLPDPPRDDSGGVPPMFPPY